MKTPLAMSNSAIMTKLIALATAGLFAAGTMFVGEHGNCTKQVGNEAKMACQVSLASLNLTPEQKTKMDAAMEEHHKAGCSEASEEKSMQEAKTNRSKGQHAKFEAQCKKGEKGKTQTLPRVPINPKLRAESNLGALCVRDF